MKYLSAFSGIEAATVAWKPLVWECLAMAEVEKFPCAVLKHHYPDVPNLGDVTKFKEWPNCDPDVLVGGSPCQSFSVAGLRKGLDDPRGNLMLTYLAIANRYKPNWLVWENVPGVLSSNRGRDFGIFLSGLAQLGYGFAYRVLDAQFFGVAQRRRRVFVVGYFGSWQYPAAVLFEQASLSGHSKPSREKKEDIAPTVTGGPPFSRTGNERVECDALVIDKISPALRSQAQSSHRPDSESYVIHGTQDPIISIEKAHTLGTNNGQENAVCFAQNTRNEVREMKVCGALTAQPGMKQQSYLRQGMQVRRLTTIECERLQGFPDNYTQIPWRNNTADKCPDGPRYKAIGNSMAVPVMRWIGERINMVEAIK